MVQVTCANNVAHLRHNWETTIGKRSSPISRKHRKQKNRHEGQSSDIIGITMFHPLKAPGGGRVRKDLENKKPSLGTVTGIYREYRYCSVS